MNERQICTILKDEGMSAEKNERKMVERKTENERERMNDKARGTETYVGRDRERKEGKNYKVRK